MSLLDRALEAHTGGAAPEQQPRLPKRAAAETLARLAAAWSKELSRAQLAVYYDALEDLDSRDLEMGVRVLVREERWFPPPSVVRKYALDAECDRQRAEREEARRHPPQRTLPLLPRIARMQADALRLCGPADPPLEDE